MNSGSCISADDANTNNRHHKSFSSVDLYQFFSSPNFTLFPQLYRNRYYETRHHKVVPKLSIKRKGKLDTILQSTGSYRSKKLNPPSIEMHLCIQGLGAHRPGLADSMDGFVRDDEIKLSNNPLYSSRLVSEYE